MHKVTSGMRSHQQNEVLILEAQVILLSQVWYALFS